MGAETYDATASESDAIGSSMVLRLHGFSVHNRTAGSYGALSTTVQLKGFNLDVIPAPVRGLQGKHQLSPSLRSTVLAWRFDACTVHATPCHTSRAFQLHKHFNQEKRKERTTPFGANLMRSQVLYRAAQLQSRHCTQAYLLVKGHVPARQKHGLRCFEKACYCCSPLALS